jgi:hypothetical protein
MLQVTDVRRAGAEVLEVAFALVPIAQPASPASVPPASPASTSAAAGPPVPVPGGEEWLAASYLLDEERGTRFYVMRDAAGRPRCSPAPQGAAGARREMSARFPAPAGTRVTIVVPGMPPFRGIAVPGTPAPGPSY